LFADLEPPAEKISDNENRFEPGDAGPDSKKKGPVASVKTRGGLRHPRVGVLVIHEGRGLGRISTGEVLEGGGEFLGHSFPRGHSQRGGYGRERTEGQQRENGCNWGGFGRIISGMTSA